MYHSYILFKYVTLQYFNALTSMIPILLSFGSYIIKIEGNTKLLLIKTCIVKQK